MSDPQTLAPTRNPGAQALAQAPRAAAVPLAVAPRAPSADGLVAGGWDDDPVAAIHGHSLDALMAGGTPVAFVLGTRAAAEVVLPPTAPIAGRIDPLGDSIVRPVLLGNSAMLVEASPPVAR